MKKELLTLTGLFIICLIYGQEQTEKLDKILDRLAEIKTASYYNKSSSSAPGDTLAFHVFERYVNMYENPSDTFVGACFSTSAIGNHTEYDLCYDGVYSVRFDWKKRRAEVDTITSDKPFSRPMAPFFMKVKSLLQYTKANLENSTVKFLEFDDSLKINFYFKDKMVEIFSLRPFVNDSEGTVSRYELVVDKNFLPYKLVRRMPHQTSIDECKDFQLSSEKEFDFNALLQIPPDFKVEGEYRGEPKTLEMEGQTAPSWKLMEVYGDSISLDEIQSKVVLIQFTGIGCGPCHASIPFMKKLETDNKDRSFEIMCIETWSDNISGIKRYKDKNEINFKFLVSNNYVTEKYKIEAVPVFLILDENRTIKKVIVGYQKDVTDKEIIKTINKLI